MAHFAQLDANNNVTRVVVVENSRLLDEAGAEQEQLGVAFLQSLFGAGTTWKQTSYNGSIRKNYAGVGFIYDAGRDAFIPPRPYPSWVLDETLCQWVAPVAPPADGGPCQWDEAAQQWIAQPQQ